MDPKLSWNCGKMVNNFASDSNYGAKYIGKACVSKYYRVIHYKNGGGNKREKVKTTNFMTFVENI